MEITEKQGLDILEIVREYRNTRDVMTSPTNPERASHVQFIMFCNDRSLQLQKVMPLAVFDDVMRLYRLASKMEPGFRADRVWANYTTKDQEAFTELLGVLLGILRQQRDA